MIIDDDFVYCGEHNLWFKPSFDFESRCPACVINDDFEHMQLYYLNKLRECFDACTEIQTN